MSSVIIYIGQSRSRGCCQEFLRTLSCLDIRLEQSENEDPACRKWFEVARYDKSFMNSSLNGKGQL